MQVAFYFAGEITQVLDAIPWVHYASGNVLGHISTPEHKGFSSGGCWEFGNFSIGDLVTD